jgi:hypothetical protein
MTKRDLLISHTSPPTSEVGVQRVLEQTEGQLSSSDGRLDGGLLEPRWLEQSPGYPTGETLVRMWMECLESDAAGSIYLHPRLLLSPQAMGGEVPLLYARSVQSGERLGSLGVLMSKIMPVKPLPGVPWVLRLRGYRLVGNQFLGEQDPQGLKAFVNKVAEFIASGAGDCVLFEDLEVDSPLWTLLSEEGRRADSKVALFYPGQPQPHWWIRFPEKREEYWNHFSKKTRYNIRRSAKKLEHTLLCYRDPQDVPALLEKAHHVSTKSWQAKRRGLRVRNSRGERNFWSGIAACGGLRSYVLEQNGRPLAFVIGLQWGGCYTYEEIAYDRTYAEHSPGTVLLFRLLEDLIARDPPHLLDFGFGDGEYKHVFGNHQTQSGPMLLVRRGWRPLTVMRLRQLRTTLAIQLRAGIKRLGLTGLRRLYRR